MATFSKAKLSASTDGRGILVAATASAGTTIHTAVSGSTNFDEVWIYAINNHTADLLLTVQWGGTTSPDDSITQTIPASGGLILVIPGLILQNSNIVKAFAGTANKISIHGFVNQIR